MSSQTPNIGLTLPTGSENVSRQIINDNNTKIDTAFGGTAGRELLGYKENGDTASQAISDGSFVVWKGNLYKANGNISQGATLSVSNLTAVSSGGFNDLQGQVDSLSDSFEKKFYAFTNLTIAPNSYIDVDYPDGFTQANTFVVGFSIAGIYIDYSNISFVLNTNKIRINNASSQTWGQVRMLIVHS